MIAPATSAWNELRNHCANLSAGSIIDLEALAALLAAAGEQIGGHDSELSGPKLNARVENAAWSPPILSCMIKRNDTTTPEPSGAELQHWEVDVENRTIKLMHSGPAKIRRLAKAVPMKTLVEGVVSSIVNGQVDARIAWDGAEKVKLNTCEVFPKESGIRRSLETKRNAFRSLVADILISKGWTQLGRDSFQRQQRNQ